MINVIIYFLLIGILACNYYSKSLYTKYNYEIEKYFQEEQYVKERKLQLKEEIGVYGDDFLKEILNCKQ